MENKYTRTRSTSYFLRLYYTQGVSRLIFSEAVLVPALIGVGILAPFFVVEDRVTRPAFLAVVNGYVLCIILFMALFNIYLYVRATFVSETRRRLELQKRTYARAQAAQAKRAAIRTMVCTNVAPPARDAPDFVVEEVEAVVEEVEAVEIQNEPEPIIVLGPPAPAPAPEDS